jgi:hypothetical protein
MENIKETVVPTTRVPVLAVSIAKEAKEISGGLLGRSKIQGQPRKSRLRG